MVQLDNKMAKFGNEEDAAAIDERNLYLKLVIMMKMQQLLIMQIQHNVFFYSTTTTMTIINLKRLYQKTVFYDIAKSTIKANRRNFKSISMMKEGFT